MKIPGNLKHHYLGVDDMTTHKLLNQSIEKMAKAAKVTVKKRFSRKLFAYRNFVGDNERWRLDFEFSELGSFTQSDTQRLFFGKKLSVSYASIVLS